MRNTIIFFTGNLMFLNRNIFSPQYHKLSLSRKPKDMSSFLIEIDLEIRRQSADIESKLFGFIRRKHGAVNSQNRLHLVVAQRGVGVSLNAWCRIVDICIDVGAAKHIGLSHPRRVHVISSAPIGVEIDHTSAQPQIGRGGPIDVGHVHMGTHQLIGPELQSDFNIRAQSDMAAQAHPRRDGAVVPFGVRIGQDQVNVVVIVAAIIRPCARGRWSR